MKWSWISARCINFSNLEAMSTSFLHCEVANFPSTLTQSLWEETDYTNILLLLFLPANSSIHTNSGLKQLFLRYSRNGISLYFYHHSCLISWDSIVRNAFPSSPSICWFAFELHGLNILCLKCLEQQVFLVLICLGFWNIRIYIVRILRRRYRSKHEIHLCFIYTLYT
jgi:hypothetical protein